MLRVVVLGAAAGGGVPQWNCGCQVCRAARSGQGVLQSTQASIAFSADGSLIATGCDDSKVRLWDAQSGQLLKTLQGHTSRVYAVDFSDGILASASWDTTARIWDIDSGRCLRILKGHTGSIICLLFYLIGAPKKRVLP